MEEQLNNLLQKLSTILKNLRKSPKRRYLRSTLRKKYNLSREIYDNIVHLLQGTDEKTHNFTITAARQTLGEIRSFIEERLKHPLSLSFKTLVKTLIVLQNHYHKFVPKPIMAFDLKQASSLVEVFDGSPEKTDVFVDSATLLFEVTNAAQRPVLFKFLKTRLTGKARRALTADVGEDPQRLINKVKEVCLIQQSPEVLMAKLRACQQKGSVEGFCKEIDTLADKLGEIYVQQKVPVDVANKLARKAGVDALIAGIKTPETKTILKAGQYDSLSTAIQKVLENETNNTATAQMLAVNMQHKHFKNNYPNNSNSYNRSNHNGYRGRGRGNRNYNNWTTRGRGGYGHRNGYGNRGGNRFQGGNYHPNNRVYYASSENMLPENGQAPQLQNVGGRRYPEQSQQQQNSQAPQQQHPQVMLANIARR